MLERLNNTTDDGVLSLKEIRKLPGYPSEERFEKGSVVVVECAEDIPCNPCEDICSRKAITVGEDITNLPVIDEQKCNGCISCITICPGLCIFVINKNFNDKESLIYLPYEMLTFPEKGSMVDGCDRKGESVCKARVEKIIKAKGYNKTNVVAIAVPKQYFEIVRAIRF